MWEQETEKINVSSEFNTFQRDRSNKESIGNKSKYEISVDITRKSGQE